MYISSSALSGPRRRRLVVGGMLTPFTALMGVALLLVAANAAGPLSMTAFAVLALSAFAVAWWGARFWYAALRGTPEPHAWPLALPVLAFIGIFTVAGIGALRDGETGKGAGMLAVAGLLLFPSVIGGAVGLLALRKHRSRRRSGPAATQNAPESQRPHRAWGPTG